LEELVAKAFDIVHKASSDEKVEERIPFESKESGEKKKKAVRKRSRIEIVFFYGLLFVVFFIIGVNFLSAGSIGNFFKRTSPSPSSSAAASSSPDAGFAIDQQGQTNEQAAKEIGTASPSPTTSTSAAAKTTPSPASSAAATKAKIQILNGTNKEGAAAAMRTKLSAEGIAVDNIGNNDTRDVAATVTYYKDGYEATANQIKAIVGGTTKRTAGGIGEYNVLVLIGTD
jgi:cytoskeletal protein RodZ